MDVLTFETCWAVNSEIIKQVTSNWSIFIHLFFWNSVTCFIYSYTAVILECMNIKCKKLWIFLFIQQVHRPWASGSIYSYSTWNVWTLRALQLFVLRVRITVSIFIQLFPYSLIYHTRRTDNKPIRGCNSTQTQSHSINTIITSAHARTHTHTHTHTYCVQ